jgi:uncharacterized cupin superfamily protein
MRRMADANIWADDWDEQDDWAGGGAQSRRLPRGRQLGATLYQLGPGDFGVLHFHHAQEELLVVLRGKPTLRTHEGERRLREGDVVHFPTGPDGTHGLRNDTDEDVRLLFVSTLRSPEVVEYPELKQITAQARARSQTGEWLWFVHDVE